MRNLTIQRQKSFVASMASLKVYIEDPVNGDLNINGSMCRKLGTIKNGETVTFQVTEEAARVYVIADKLSRKYCNEFYPLPEGDMDVVLSGKCHYNPGAGNPFRFDGVTDEAVLKNRKRRNRFGIILIVASVIIGFAIGFAMNSEKPQKVTVGNMEMTLTTRFDRVSAPGFDAAFESGDVVVFVLRERFSLQPEMQDYSTEEYAKLVMQNNGHNGFVKMHNGMPYFDYDATGNDGVLYHYFVTVHKGPDSFWLVQFCVQRIDMDKLRSDIFEWASTVKFTE